MKQTDAIVVGASIAGLSAAACLQKQNTRYIIIEKEAQVATPWRNHYHRLHLHTNKSLSNLPFKKFGNNIPRYPSRLQVIEYLDDYQKAFNITPVFNTEAKSIKKQNDYWITETSSECFQSKYVIIATGSYGKPKAVFFKGMETFPGNILHSYGYTTGSDFINQKVLVVGFGNSACEIAIDLYEQGAVPCMSVRSPVNIVPRDLLGIPILRISMLMSMLPPRLADKLNAPIIRLLYGDITKLGLKKMPYGTFEQIKKDGKIPVLDIGTIKHIKQGHITIYDDIDFIDGKTVHFVDGKEETFDSIIAATGYYRDYTAFVQVDKRRFDDLNVCASKQKYFGEDGLYFCGFWVSPTGVIREIALDAQKIAKDIAKKEKTIKNVTH